MSSSFLLHVNGNHPNNNNTDGIAYTLSRTYFTVTSRTHWNISYLPGPTFSTTILPNSSTDKYYPVWLLILIGIFGGVTSILTILGNTLVILAFFLDRQIRQPTNYFILSLSLSDFLIGLLSMPLLTIYIYAKDWPLNATICDIWLSLDYTVCLTSIYTVLLITIDRFCSVKMPAKYRKWRTTRKINIMIAITWAGKIIELSHVHFLVFSVPFLIFFTATMLYPRLQRSSNLNNGVCAYLATIESSIKAHDFSFFFLGDVQWNKNHVFNLCLTIAYFWTTLFVMIVLYIFIYGKFNCLY